MLEKNVNTSMQISLLIITLWQAPAPVTPAGNVKKKFETRKVEAKVTDKKGKAIAAGEGLVDPVAEKLRQQRYTSYCLALLVRT